MENENYLKTLKEGLQIELKESGKKIPDSLYETYSSLEIPSWIERIRF